MVAIQLEPQFRAQTIPHPTQVTVVGPNITGVEKDVDHLFGYKLNA